VRIKAAATAGGVNAQTLRFYERRGLLSSPRRTGSGYREYSDEDVRVVRFIRNAKELGFSLGEIQGLLRLREAPEPDRVLALTLEKIADIDRRIKQLTALRRTLSGLANSCRHESTSRHCVIIDALDARAS
jgi:DNA-binding transcriptional MerR regulator